jgi:hypothetical protein
MNISKFLEKKPYGYYFFLASALCALIAWLTYCFRGGDVLTNIDAKVIILFAVGIVLNVLLAIKDIKPLEIVPFILYFSAILVFVDSEITFISNIAWGTDGNHIDGGFIVIALFGVLSVIAGMVASIAKIEKES